MQNWNNILQDERFQKLPQDKKISIASRFFDDFYAKDKRFVSLPSDKQDNIKMRFFGTVADINNQFPENPEEAYIKSQAGRPQSEVSTELSGLQSPIEGLKEPAKNIAKQTGKNLFDIIYGTGQTAQNLGLGAAGFTVGSLSSAGEIASQIQSNPKLLLPVLFPKAALKAVGVKPENFDWSKVEGVFKKVNKGIASLEGALNNQPKSRFGETATQVAGSPFAILEEGLDKFAKGVSDDKNTQAQIRMMGRLGLFFTSYIKDTAMDFFKSSESKLKYEDAAKDFKEGKVNEAAGKLNEVLQEEKVTPEELLNKETVKQEPKAKPTLLQSGIEYMEDIVKKFPKKESEEILSKKSELSEADYFDFLKEEVSKPRVKELPEEAGKPQEPSKQEEAVKPESEKKPSENGFKGPLKPTQNINSITLEKAGELIKNGDSEVIRHIKEGLKSGKLTIDEMQDAIRNQILREISKAPKEERPIVKENIKKVEPTINKVLRGEEVKIPKSAKPSTPEVPKELLDFIESRIQSGEAGKRIYNEETGKWSGASSTYPDWFKNKDLTKKETLNIIKKVKEGRKLTSKQEEIFNDIVEGARKEFREAYPKRLIKLSPEEVAGFKEGQKVLIKDNVYEYKGINDEGKVILENTKEPTDKISLDLFDEPIFVDKVLKEGKEFKLEPEEAGPKPSKPFQPELNLKAEKEALKGKLPSKEAPLTPLEEAAKQAEEEKIKKEYEEKQQKILESSKEEFNQSGEIKVNRILGIIKTLKEAIVHSDSKTKIYKAVHKFAEKLRSEVGLASFDAQLLQKYIIKKLPSKQGRELIAYALEDPEFVKQMTPAQKDVYNAAKNFYEDYRKRLKNEGILDEFIDDYVNHIIIKAKDKEVSFSRFTKQRVRKKTEVQGEIFPKERESLFSKEGPLTIKELEELGYVVEKDIANLMAIYEYTAKKAIANKRFVEALKKLKDSNGKNVLRLAKDVPLEERKDYILIDSTQFQRWSGYKKGDKTVLFKSPTYLHKDAWDIVDNMVRSTRPPAKLYKLFVHFRGGVKRVIMFNPLIHGFNVESSVFMALGPKDYFTKRFRKISEAGKEALSREMIINGVELEGLFKIRKKLYEDIYSPKIKSSFELESKNIQNIMNHPLKAMAHWNDTILWDGIVKSGQLIVYKTLKERMLEKGLSEAQAGQAAAMMTNDFLGTMPKTWFTKNQRKVLFNLMFARNWTIGNLRTLTGATGTFAKSEYLPKPLRFEGITDTQLKAVGGEYRKAIIRGVIGAYVTANAIQAMFLKMSGQSYHPTWQNEEDHKMDIDTGMIDNMGRRIYLRNWAFRQIDDYVKLFEGHLIQFGKAKMEPILRTMLEVITNSDYRNKPIIKKGMTRTQAIKELGKYMVKGITPLDTFAGREDEVRTWFEAIIPLTGTWIRHGFKDPELGNILNEYYDYKAKKSLLSEELRQKVKVLIQQGKEDEAWKLVDGVNMTVKKFVNIKKSIQFPFWYRVAGETKLKSDFVEFLMTMPKKDREKFFKYIQNMNLDKSIKRRIKNGK